MAGMAGLTAEEQRIYDEFSAGMRALSDKAKSDAKAIGADIMSIIGPTEAAVVSDVKNMRRRLFGGAFYFAFLIFLTTREGNSAKKRFGLALVFHCRCCKVSIGSFPALLRGLCAIIVWAIAREKK